MSAPPANPKRRMFADGLVIGDWYERITDHTRHQLRNVFGFERRVQLEPAWDEPCCTVSFDALRRDYRRVAA